MLHLIPDIKCSLVLPYISHQYGIVCIILPLPRWVSRLRVSSQLSNKPWFHPSAPGADLHPLYLLSSSTAFANIIQKEYLCERDIYVIVFQLLLCRPTFLRRSTLNRGVSHCAVTVLQPPCVQRHVQTHSIIAPIRFQNQGWIAAGCPDRAHRLIFALVSCLQVSSPPGWRRPLQLCLTLSGVFKAVTQSPCMSCEHQKASMFKVVLSGWRGGCSSCEMPELLLALLSPSSLSASVIFSIAFARKMCCISYTQVHTCMSFTLPGWHCSVTVHGMMKGCIARIVKHSKSSTFY